MRELFILWSLWLCAIASPAVAQTGSVPPRQIVPMEVKIQAQDAAQKIVDQAIRGNYDAALEAMNPEYVKVASRPYGGSERYKAGLKRQMQEMGKNGVSFIAAVTQPADVAFEVDFGFRDRVVDGQVVKVPGYWTWMVFVPVIKDFQFLDEEQEPAKLRKFRKWGFEVAISEKGSGKWTFISGDNINALQLRKLFPFLPKEDEHLSFPPIKIEERTNK